MEIKQIKIGEIFEVCGKLYAVGMPVSPGQDTNTHGQIVLELHLIE